MIRSHQIKIATDWLRLASDPKIGLNGTMLYQCNPTDSSLKPDGCKFIIGCERSHKSTLVFKECHEQGRKKTKFLGRERK